ncbi:heavy metal translocating P-type ATPase [Lutispora saccharofermentans]|uniref:Cd(2+)-exporting ATPase n=1 Tax=Lutispora saccharofermentans TaxID=3024236 RepID=A0ABT1NP46_9FIRM|nr:cation-translocating P-type ATPase [Lutispora saccharofermentans]MCQ1531721.1 cation-translocating P-type ATPase [Lutispora saccharofermentans]
MIKISRGQRVLISGLLILLSFALRYLISDPVWKDALMIMAALIAGYPIALNAFRAIRFKIVGIDALVTLAVAGALIIGEYWEAAAVTFLFMFGAYLEGKTLEKTRSAIKALLDLAPNTAKVIREGTEIEIPAEEVIKGEIVIIRPGEKIPVDGTVVEGSSYVNQAAITGESIPVSRGEDETVFSGTVIESGYIKVRADRVGEDTTFSRILQMVEEAQDKKAKTQKFLEVFSKYYTPGIIVLAVLVFMITRDIELALTLLVIACPGALVISTPVSIVAGIGNGAKHGVLMKGGEIIEKLGTVKVLAFDKTGTLTIGKPKVTKIKAFEWEEEELLRVTAIAEGYSEHPLAKAVLEEASKRFNDDLSAPGDLEIIAGHGLKAKIEGRTILVGNRKLMEENDIDIPDEIEDYIRGEEALGQTAVITADRDKILGVISIADDIREGADRLIKKLKDKGIKRIVMLTGDNKRAASAIAKKLNLDDYYAELLPEGKVQMLKKLQEEYGITAMVGDGVNDAPALASADLGIAMGGAGSDVAMEAADVVLMSAELKKLSYAIGLSRATVINMKQNIYFAIAVVITLIAGVLLKLVFLSSGMLIHEISVLLVIINAIRLLGYGKEELGKL